MTVSVNPDQLANDVEARMAEQLPGEGGLLIAHLARSAVMTALGCTCRHRDRAGVLPGPVYREDMNCPVKHGDT